jgi:hypothetical protein
MNRSHVIYPYRRTKINIFFSSWIFSVIFAVGQCRSIDAKFTTLTGKISTYTYVSIWGKVGTYFAYFFEGWSHILLMILQLIFNFSIFIGNFMTELILVFLTPTATYRWAGASRLLGWCRRSSPSYQVSWKGTSTARTWESNSIQN